MNISEILRGLLDLVDNNQSDDSEIAQVGDDSTDGSGDPEEMALMIPPLQQKIELLKKAVDVPNVYSDGECGCEGCQTGTECCADGEEDELSRIKKIAGVPTAAIMTLSDDDISDD